MIRLFIIISFLCVTSISCAKTYVLFNSGKTNYVILVSSDASISEKYAASELQYWLKEISGVTFPIVNNLQSAKGKKIIIGYFPTIMESFSLQRPDDEDQGFVYGNNGDDIYIVGGKKLGTLYGVYSFLENEFSCRWYTKDVYVAPKRKSWMFKKLYDKEKPAFNHRKIYYFDALNVDWSLRNKFIGRNINKKTVYGSFTTTDNTFWGTHTFKYIVSPDKYFESHPEYFSLRNGVRTKDQLCLSNNAVIQLCKERLREIIKTHPNYKIYSVTQNDNVKPCQCLKCKEIIDKYGGEAGLMIWFLNQIASSLESEFPDKLFATFAYFYTRKAPKNITPRKNVIIRFSSSGCCETHPLVLCEKNASFVSDLSQWSQITSNLYIWDYVVSFRQYLLPYPNIRILQKNVQLYRKYNAQEVFSEGVYDTTGGDFYELRAYLLAKLLWNPDINVDEIIDDFMKGYYQSSSVYMKMYFDKVQSLASEQTHLMHSVTDKNSIYSSDFINSSMSLLTKAEKAADDDEVLDRVLRQKMVVAYLHCRKNPEKAIQDGSYDLVMKVTKKIGMTKFVEGGGNSIEDFENKMEKVKNSMNNKYSKEYLEYKLSKFLENIKI